MSKRIEQFCCTKIEAIKSIFHLTWFHISNNSSFYINLCIADSYCSVTLGICKLSGYS